MTLAALKVKLQTVGSTGIGEVFFDWKTYLNETRSKTYPCVLWSLDGANFVEDYRTDTIQKVKLFKITVYAIAQFDQSQDKITAWDTLEGLFKAYINAMNETSGLQVMNINNINGQYAGEGLISADSEIGLLFREVQLKITC